MVPANEKYMIEKKYILLTVSIAVSLLMLLGATWLSEILYYERDFSNEMYNAHLYLPSLTVVVVAAWAIMGIYYYVLNSVVFSRWYHWLVVVALSIVAVYYINVEHIGGAFYDMDMDFERETSQYCAVLAVCEAVLCTAVSFGIRWWSSNCRHTPFPE